MSAARLLPRLARPCTLGLRAPAARVALARAMPRAALAHASLPRRSEQLRLYSDHHREPEYVASKVSPEEYHAAADRALDALTDYLELLTEEHPGANMEREAEYSSGVLNLRLGDAGTYVINKQPPNQQIWLSSPTSGPKRFDYDGTHGIWFWSKEGQVTTLKELLDTELSEVFATTVEVDLEGED